MEIDFGTDRYAKSGEYSEYIIMDGLSTNNIYSNVDAYFVDWYINLVRRNSPRCVNENIHPIASMELNKVKSLYTTRNYWVIEKNTFISSILPTSSSIQIGYGLITLPYNVLHTLWNQPIYSYGKTKPNRHHDVFDDALRTGGVCKLTLNQLYPRIPVKYLNKIELLREELDKKMQNSGGYGYYYGTQEPN